MIKKEIKGYEGLYEIDEFGNVFSKGNGNSTCPHFNIYRQIKSRKKKNGYLEVKLFKNGIRKYFTIHKLVALNFIENRYNKNQINHIDCNKENNHFSNLEWVTSKENILHSIKNGLQVNKKGIENTCSKQVIQKDKKGNFIKEWGSINELKRELGYNSFGIIKCCKKEKKYKTAYGYKWEYKNVH